MLKTILGLIAKVLESKIVRSGLEEKILKNKNYIVAAKEVWNIIEENFRIAEKVEEKLKSKADEFDKLLLAKFPELTQEDVKNLRQSIAGELNQGKAAVLENSELLKKLQEDNAKLQAENAELNNKIAQMQNIVTVNTVQA